MVRLFTAIPDFDFSGMRSGLFRGSRFTTSVGLSGIGAADGAGGDFAGPLATGGDAGGALLR